REALDRRHLGIRDERREREAGEHRDSVDEDRARAAFTELAPVFGTGEVELLAKHFEQGVMRVHGDGAGLAVHAKGDQLLAHAASAPIRCESARAAETHRSPMRRSVRRSTRSLNPTTMTT